MNDIRLFVTLGCTPQSAQATLRRLDQALTRWHWGSAGSRADARLVIKNLIDDALEHAGSGLTPDISLELTRSGHRLRIAVTDSTPDRRHTRPVDSAGDHGLHLVKSIAAQWGSAPHPRGGTTVWCELISIPEPRQPAPSETLDIAA